MMSTARKIAINPSSPVNTASTAQVRLIQLSTTRTTGSRATARKSATASQVSTWLTAPRILTAAAAMRTSAITRTIVRVGTSMTIRRWTTHGLSTPGAESRQGVSACDGREAVGAEQDRDTTDRRRPEAGHVGDGDRCGEMEALGDDLRLGQLSGCIHDDGLRDRRGRCVRGRDHLPPLG